MRLPTTRAGKCHRTHHRRRKRRSSEIWEVARLWKLSKSCSHRNSSISSNWKRCATPETSKTTSFSLSLSDQELKAFIGILLYSGYSPLPSERMYWSNDDDLSRPIVRQAMTRSEYLKIKSYLHVQDNNKQKESKDRGFKVRPLIEMINKSFQQFGIFESKLAIDEMIVRYYGHNSLKQFIRGKPIRFGYKLWAACGSDGFCYKFDLYCGKEERAELRDQPLGTSAEWC